MLSYMTTCVKELLGMPLLMSKDLREAEFLTFAFFRLQLSKSG